MEQNFGYFIVLGLMLGIIFGVGFGGSTGNPLLGIGLGALGGVFLGWFVAAAVLENQDKKQ